MRRHALQTYSAEYACTYLASTNGVRRADRSHPRVLPGETRVVGDAGHRQAADRPRLRGRRRIRRRACVELHRRRLRRGRRAARRCRRLGAPTSCSRSTRRRTEEIAKLRDGATLVALLSPALNPELVEALAAAADHGAGDGRGAAHLARPVAGRAQLDGQHRRLPRRDRGGARVRPVLHRPGDRRGQGAAGQGAGRRRRRRRAGRDRRGEQPGRDRARHRPAARGRRAGALARRRLPGRRGRSSRSAPTATRRRRPRTTTAARPRSTPSRPPTSTSSSPPR